MTNLTPEEINRALALFRGDKFIRYRFWYSGHDNKKPYRCFDTKEEAERDRKKEVKWGCGEVEQFEDVWRIPNYCGLLDEIQGIEAKLTDEQWNYYIADLFQTEKRGSILSSVRMREAVHATALQKATALVRALGLEGETC